VNDAESDRTVPESRRDAVLDSALLTFARFGYRKTSMEDVARAADISRPGLYFLFTSKQDLFRESATRALDLDVAETERVLGSDAPLRERLVAAFDVWAGRYVGPLRDVEDLLRDDPALLGDAPATASARFSDAITAAFAEAEADAESAIAANAADRARVLLDASVGIKHRVATRDEYRAEIATAVRVLTPTSSTT
jgi:AcrR family transcriptional regulator